MPDIFTDLPSTSRLIPTLCDEVGHQMPVLHEPTTAYRKETAMDADLMGIGAARAVELRSSTP